MIQLNQYISEKLNIDKDVKDIPEEELYKQYFETLKDKFKKEGINATGTFRKTFGEYNSQWIRLSYLKPEDEPDIAANGMYLIFDIDFNDHIIELKDNGHIYLTKEDQHKSNLAMTGIKNLYKKEGKPYFRKTRYKSIDDCTKKILAFYNSTKELLDKYSEGYPYKDMKLNIY
jgi:hypothetical protein